ncbi:DNA helicase [Tanacetum coccineum]|uniref:DNA helicase n=1 Tax=Tanacetum coccineum TaxID=301880 RepID=A0ABQ5A144_9ASTR
MKTKRKLVPKPIGTGGCGKFSNYQNEGGSCIPSGTNVIEPVGETFAEDAGVSKRRCIRDVEYVGSSNVAPQSSKGSGQCIFLNACLDVVDRQPVGSDVGGSKRKYSDNLGNLTNDGHKVLGQQILGFDVGRLKPEGSRCLGNLNEGGHSMVGEQPFASHVCGPKRKLAYNELPGRANVKDAVLTVEFTLEDATSQSNNTTSISGNIIGLALWNEMAMEFDMQTYDSLPKPVVIAVSSCWVSRYNGLQLSATSATHYYLNPNIPETLHIKQQNEQSTDTTPFLIINNQRYEDPNLERTRNRFPLATLLKINPQNYQLQYLESTRKKNGTTKDAPSAAKSYSFKAIVSDGSATTSITCFSNQANTLTRDIHEVLAELADKNPYHIPESLRQLEGTTHTFQFYFDTLSTSRRPDFVLDTVF